MTDKNEGGKRKDDVIMSQSAGDGLFRRVAAILEVARSNVARSVNTNMVLAYWLIGREIVQELQGGQDRAEYGKQIVENLSAKLTKNYGRGFSTTNLWYFRQFFQVYSNRLEILHPAGGESGSGEILHITGGELISTIESRLSGDQSQRPFSVRQNKFLHPSICRFYQPKKNCNWNSSVNAN